MNAVTKHEAAQPPAEYAASLMEVITRAASDPAVDIDKLERLIAMQERIEARNAKAAFLEAKIAMRPHLPSIDMRGRIVIKDKNSGEITQETPFAKFEDIQLVIEPILTEHGFDLSFKNGLSEEGKVRVTTILTHRDGHSEDTYFDLPHDSSGSKNSVQAVGSSTSYAKRYGVVSILNLRVAGQDDDGETAIAEMPDDEWAKLVQLLEATKTNADVMLKALGIKAPNIKTLNEKQYATVIDALNRKLAKMARDETNAKAQAHA